MRKIVFLSLVFVLVASLAFAAEKVTREEAVSLVDKAAAYLKANGEARAFAEFDKPDGIFNDLSRDLYMFAFDMTGICLSHGANPALIGRDLSGLRDNDGSLFIQEFVTVAQTKGSGWINYNWSNPTTRLIEPKSSYIIKVSDNVLIGTGIYQ